ncbi:MAG: S4 domain-containing protein, partial [Desulfovibrio sp.]|uniref:S4 domain-containing protein n=1 Tax=Desulfovibrio sp. TaxID=885 RepID=UPI002A7ED873
MSWESPRQLDFRVAGALVGQRLDKALCGLLPDLSRAAVQRAITAGTCRIDGLPVSTVSLKLKAGQEVRLDLPDTANELRAEDEAVNILWQDEHLLLCNKPAG